MDCQDKVIELKKIIFSVLEQEGVELIELNFNRSKGGALLRLLVDRNDGGISIQDCARLNETVGKILETQDIISDRYLLEVSSPGLDRPLKEKKDFTRCIGRMVRVWLNEPITDKKEFAGLIKEVRAESVAFEVDGNIMEIPLEKIDRAKQII